MRIQRYSDVVESISEKAIYFVFGGIMLGAFGGLLLRYRGDGYLVPFAWLCMITATVLFCVGVYVLTRVTKVESYTIDCPICYETNQLTSKPENDDITCIACNHRIPIMNGAVLPVSQVQCGFCKSLNYYSEKTDLLICESCNREIPIFQEDGKPTKQLPKGYAIVDDNSLYELVLVEGSKTNEDLVKTLQSMLALNRNQVRDILDDLPQSLLQGINHTKSEMLSAQISIHGGKCESRVMQNP